MSKGGGGGPTETTVTNNSLPEYAQPYYEDLMRRMTVETGRPYETYGGQRLAYFSPMEQEALARFGQMGVSGTPPELDAAGANAYDLMMGGGRDTRAYSDYTAGVPWEVGYRPDTRNSGFEAGNMYGDALDPYQSQYMQDVVDVQKREAARQADQRGAQIGTEAAGAGSLGGYREAIMQAENERNLMQEMGDIQAEGSQRAYENAQQAFEADRQARAQQEQLFAQQFQQNQQNIQAGQGLEMQKYQAYEQARQQAAAMGLTAQEIEQAGQQAAAQIRLDATGMMGNFAQQRQDMEYERLQRMMQAGTMERDLLQRGLDIGYQDFLRQQGYPLEMLNYYSMMLQGNTIAPGQTTQTFGREPSGMQQAIGTGIAGVGLYNSLGGKGGQAGGGGGGGG